MEINNVPLWFSKHSTKWFMQISQSEACNKLATHCFSAFHPMHAATCSGPCEREKMSGWMELILGRKNNSTGKNLTLPESKFFPRWSAGSVQCFNIGALAQIAQSFSSFNGNAAAGLGGQKGGLESLGNMTLNRKGLDLVPCVPADHYVKVSLSKIPNPPAVPEAMFGRCALTSQSEAEGIKKKSFSPQGINYNIISHYNYYRLLRYNDSSNCKLSSLSTILRGRLWWVSQRLPITCRAQHWWSSMVCAEAQCFRHYDLFRSLDHMPPILGCRRWMTQIQFTVCVTVISLLCQTSVSFFTSNTCV